MNEPFIEWRNAEKTVLAIVSGNHTVLVEPGAHDWEMLSSLPDIRPYQDMTPPALDPLQLERAGMRASRFQAKAALYQAGLLPAVERLLSQSESFMHKLAWDEAGEFYRDSPTIAHLAGSMGLDDLAIDELFRLAMSIRA